MDLSANLRHRLLNLDGRLSNMLEQGLRERAMAAFWAVLGRLVRAAGAGNQRSLIGSHFGEAAGHGER